MPGPPGASTAADPSPRATDSPRTPSLTLLQEPQGGGLAVVHCTVDSIPPATLALYRDGDLVATSGSQAAPSQRLAVTATRNALRLEIRGVRPQDGGQYRCTATNALGNASATQPFVTHSESCRALPAPVPGAGGAAPPPAQTRGCRGISAWLWVLPCSRVPGLVLVVPSPVALPHPRRFHSWRWFGALQFKVCSRVCPSPFLPVQVAWGGSSTRAWRGSPAPLITPCRSPRFGELGWKGSSNERRGGESPQKHIQGNP